MRPDIGVVTSIGTDHYSAFGSIDDIAREKGRLVRELPESGVAVLNADDPRVSAMRAGCRARVISYGVSAGADLRAVSVEARWPDRLSFVLLHGESRVRVRTQLCGAQWVSAALAAAAVGVAMDVPLTDIARALAGVAPYEARMSPLVLPDGVTFIRDDWKASLHTLPPAFEFLRTARAARRVLVVGTISDYAGDASRHYSRTAKYALEVADYVVFVGSRAASALRARPADEPERLRAFGTVKSAARFFSDFLMPGDLVLLKGSNPADHLCRLAIARASGVTCWREKCGRLRFCGNCELVNAAPKRERERAADEPAAGEAAATMAGYGGTVVVGLGNPGERYRGTPHNVGQAVLARIAAEAGATWAEAPGASAALVDWRGVRLCLVSPGTVVNRSGPTLHALFAAAGIAPEQVILVFDDLDLPLAKVRMRMRGSDGGHRGVRSILEAFQTDRFQRIKIGVRRPGEPGQAREAVLRPFDKAEHVQVETAMAKACDLLYRMATTAAAGSSADVPA